MRVLKAQLYNQNNESMTNILLPASYEELEDALQIVNGKAEDCAADIMYFLNNADLLDNKTVRSCNLYELNYLATILASLKEHEQEQFKGIVEATCQSEYPEIKEIINIALNAPKLDCMLAPASNDHDLGEFYVENELIDGLANLESLSDEAYEWVCKHLDLAQIGKEVRENERGAFVSNGYMVIGEELKNLYDGTPKIPKPKDYIFRLELAKIPLDDQPNDEHTVSLKLPASDGEIKHALMEIGAKEMSDCCFYGYESVVIPQLSDIYGDNDDFNALNYLAEQIIRFDGDSIIKFKAMLEAAQCQTLDTALKVHKNMNGFTLERNYCSPSDYVDAVLAKIDLPMKEQLNYYLSKDGYGRSLMQHNGVDKTSYGMLIPNDGIKLSELLEQKEQGMNMTMSM